MNDYIYLKKPEFESGFRNERTNVATQTSETSVKVINKKLLRTHRKHRRN